MRWPRGLNTCLRAFSAGAALLLLIGAPAARAQERIWTDQDGRRYDASPSDLYNNQITFRRPDGSTFTLQLQDLIPEDQQSIHDWFYKQPKDVGTLPPPTQRLSPYGRSFVLDTPRVLRLRPLASKGYADAFLGIPITLRNDNDGPLEFVNLYIYDVDRKQREYPIVPPDGPLMVQDGDTTAFIRPGDFKIGQTYMVLYPLQEPASRTATYIVVVAGNDYRPVSIVYPSGSWRDFSFPEHDKLDAEKYSDFSAQELYPEKNPSDLFEIAGVTRLLPLSGDHSSAHDFFRLALRIKVALPAAALSGQWYAFDKNHQLLKSVGQPPYSNPGRTDIFYFVVVPGRGPADISDAIIPTQGTEYDTLELPDGAWWDNPEVDSLVFVFGTETKKVAQVFSKSGATLADLPVPEKAAFGDVNVTSQPKIPQRIY
ncbi:MAG: hypothetical protein ABSH19_00600 [Opitutales bacterium]|jgi:hypothetical protein